MNKKLEKQEVEDLKTLRQQNQSVILELGNLELTQIKLDQRKDEIIDLLDQLQQKEKELSANLYEKYGDGSIDLDKEEFISS